MTAETRSSSTSRRDPFPTSRIIPRKARTMGDDDGFDEGDKDSSMDESDE